MHAELKILRAGETLMVSMDQRRAGSDGAVALLEAVEPDWGEVEALCAEIARHLTAQRQPRGVLGRMERAGQLLFDQLMGPRVKRALRASAATHLKLQLQTSLLEIPWELLHDGEHFLCLRFALGRIALSEGELADPPGPLPPGPLSLLIVADPRGDLPHAEAEGQALLDLALDVGGPVTPDLLPSPTGRRAILEALRGYEAVHLAGHGEGGGWLMEDGALTARDVARLRGGRLPALIFANACASSEIAGWDPGAGAMARTFLLGGTRHFIGASCELPDHTGITMALAFHKALWAGATVGASLSAGRQALAADRALPPLAWAGYVLYGDPSAVYVERPTVLDTTEGGVQVTVPREAQDAPGGDRPAFAPRRHTRLTPGERRRLALRLVAGALVGLCVGAISALEAFKVLPLLDAMWIASLERAQGSQPFATPVVLLGVGRRTTHPRPLYTQLLTGLTSLDGPGPDVVAFDTWFADLEPGEAPTDEDRRMMEAFAGALERFPVVIGQKWERGAPRPAPAWLMDGIREALRARASERCGGCEVEGDPPFWERLALGHVAVDRVVEGIFWDLDHRVPFSCDGAAGVPFSWRVAFPRDRHRPLCRGGGWSYGVKGESVDIPLDAWGRMVLTYTGGARWVGPQGLGPQEGDGAGFPAFELEKALAGWAKGEGMRPGDLSARVVIVGRAQADAEASDADRRRTPLGEMYGVEVQANAVEELRQRRAPSPARPLWSVGVAALVGALAAAWAGHPRAGVRSAALAALTLGGSIALWARFGALLTPVAPLTTLVLVILAGRLLRRSSGVSPTS